MACLGLECLARRRYRALAEVAVASAGMLAVFGVIYETLMRPRIIPSLNWVWKRDYAPGNPAGAASFFLTKMKVLAP